MLYLPFARTPYIFIASSSGSSSGSSGRFSSIFSKVKSRRIGFTCYLPSIGNMYVARTYVCFLVVALHGSYGLSW